MNFLQTITATAMLCGLAHPVAAQLVADFSSQPTGGTAPLTVQFTDMTSGGSPIGWTWDFGDGSGTSLEQSPSHTYAEPGTYSVSLYTYTVFLLDSDTVIKQDLIVVKPTPFEVAFSSTHTVGEAPFSVQFTNESTEGFPVHWLWDFGDGSHSSQTHPEHTFTSAGTFTVTLSASLPPQSWTGQQLDLVTIFPEPPGPLDPPEFVFLQQKQSAEMHHASATGNEILGAAVALNGHGVALIGAPGEGLGGVAHLFDDSAGSQMATLIPGDVELDDSFGLAVAINATTALVGAPDDADNGVFSGSAYLFDLASGTQLAKLLPDDGGAFDRFGTSVALSETLPIALVGSPGDGNVLGGAAYLFDTITGTQIARLAPSDGPDYFDSFGVSVAISGSIAIIGAPHPNSGSVKPGRAYLFDILTGAELFKLESSEATAYDRVGSGVAIDDGLAVVGAPFTDVYCCETCWYTCEPYWWQNVGAAYVFDVASGVQVSALRPADPVGAGLFGNSVSMDGGVAMVGSPYWSESQGLSPLGTETGRAYVFDLASGTQLARFAGHDTAAGDRFGNSVAIEGTTLLAGALSHHHAAPQITGNHGAAYLFEANSLEGHVVASTEHAIIWADLGLGLAGALGAPTLEGSSSVFGGASVQLDMSGAAPAAPATLVIGLEPLSAFFKGGVVVPSPDILVEGLITDGGGVLQLSSPTPNGLPDATTLYLQAWIVDASGPKGLTASNGLMVTFH
jgi:hypothetical protein